MLYNPGFSWSDLWIWFLLHRSWFALCKFIVLLFNKCNKPEWSRNNNWKLKLLTDYYKRILLDFGADSPTCICIEISVNYYLTTPICFNLIIGWWNFGFRACLPNGTNRDRFQDWFEFSLILYHDKIGSMNFIKATNTPPYLN